MRTSTITITRTTVPGPAARVVSSGGWGSCYPSGIVTAKRPWIAGLAIGVAILAVGKGAARTMWRQLMDAVDPETVDLVERTAGAVPGVEGVHDVRVRWLGHRLRAALHVTVDEDLTTFESHRIGEQVRHALVHAEPRLADVLVHVDPCGHGGRDAHADLADHAPPG